MRHLVAAAAPFWAGEAEIVLVYLARPRTLDDDLHWLRAQAYKETRHLRALPRPLQEEFLATGTLAAHPEGPEEARKLGDEMRHYRLITDLIAELTGTPVTPADLRALPADAALQALRAPYRAGPPLDRAIVNFTEGGGGAMYAVLMGRGGSHLERRVAEVFRAIHADEVVHGPGEIHTIARLARNPHDWDRAERAVRAICHQRLHMRNEMFRHPLDPARLAEIAAGGIEPWPLPVAL